MAKKKVRMRPEQRINQREMERETEGTGTESVSSGPKVPLVFNPQSVQYVIRVPE